MNAAGNRVEVAAVGTAPVIGVDLATQPVDIESRCEEHGVSLLT